MIFFLGIYLVVGGVSAVTNFGRWLFSSWLMGILFLPFMIIYYLIYGDTKKRTEAITILKGGLVLGIIYLITVGTIMLF
jgi:heme O synthase-like polyprenyltransferase